MADLVVEKCPDLFVGAHRRHYSWPNYLRDNHKFPIVDRIEGKPDAAFAYQRNPANALHDRIWNAERIAQIVRHGKSPGLLRAEYQSTGQQYLQRKIAASLKIDPSFYHRRRNQSGAAIAKNTANPIKPGMIHSLIGMCPDGVVSCVHHSAIRKSLHGKSGDSSVPAGTKLSFESSARLRGHYGRRKRQPMSLRSVTAMNVRPNAILPENIQFLTS